MNWGKSIVVAFVLFAGFIAVIVTICMRQEVSLVSHQYYHDDLLYQEQLERKNNAEQLAVKPDIVIVDQQLQVHFVHQQVSGGTLQVFRPSNDKLDQNFRLSTSSAPVQVFALKELEKGPYRIKMTWVADGKEFYIEKLIVI